MRGEHPHPNKHHIMTVYRGYILGCKRRFGTARSQAHHRKLIESYLLAKQQYLAGKPKEGS